MSKLLDYNATLVGRDDLMDGLAVFRVRPDAAVTSGGTPGFVPGQYLTIGLNRPTDDPNDARPLSVRRPMSISSAPSEGDTVEFYIRYVEKPESDLPLTHLLWKVDVGARMYLRPVATGHFTVDHTVGLDDARLKVFVAAGTGLAPFISIVRDRVLKDPKARLDEFAILHGASYPVALGYRTELERLAVEHGLKYVPAVSRPKESQGWTGAVGRVENLMAPDRMAELEDRLGLGPEGFRPSKAVVLVCGLNGTIAQSMENLLERGFLPNNRKIRKALAVEESEPSTYFYEQYDTEPVVDVDDPPVVDRLRATLARGRKYC